MDRILVKRTHPDGTSQWAAEFLGIDYDVDRYWDWEGDLIKRRYGDGLVEWFDIPHRTPSEDDLIDVAEAASLQLGFAVHWLLIDPYAVDTILKALGFLDGQCIKTESEALKERVTSWPDIWNQSSSIIQIAGPEVWDDDCKVYGLHAYSQLLQTAKRVLPDNCELRCLFDLGDSLGMGLVRKRVTLEDHYQFFFDVPRVDRCSPESAEILDLFKETLEVPVELATVSQDWIWCLLTCDLIEDQGPFEESLSNFKTEEQEWLRSRQVQPVADQTFVPSLRQKLILEALDGKALRVDDLDAITENRRALYDRKRPDGTIKTQGDVKELQRLGKVKYHQRLGYYRPDSPPPEVGNA